MVIIAAVFIDVTDAIEGRVAIAMEEEGLLNASEARGRLPMWNSDRARHSLWSSIMEDTSSMVLDCFCELFIVSD